MRDRQTHMAFVMLGCSAKPRSHSTLREICLSHIFVHFYCGTEFKQVYNEIQHNTPSFCCRFYIIFNFMYTIQYHLVVVGQFC